MADDSTLGLGLNNPQYQDLITKQQEAIKAANQPYGMDAGQGAIAAGLGLLPALIGGLVRGREGLAMGAQAGMAGVSSYDNILKNNYEKRAENEKANAVLYGQQASQLAQQELGLQRALQMEKIKQDNRKEIKDIYGNGGTTINNIMPGGLDKTTRKDVDPHVDMFLSMTSSLDAGKKIIEANPKLAKMSYEDIESSAKALGTGAESYIKGGATAFGEFRTAAQIAASDWLVATSGLTVPEPEFKRKMAILTGDGAVYATPETTLHFLNNIRARSRQSAQMEAAKGVMATGKASTLEEALASEQYKKTVELLNGIESGKFDAGGYSVFNKEPPQALTGPKGKFTVGGQ